MKKVLCLCMAVVMLVGMFVISPMTARAASNKKASENCLTFIKDFESFSATPYLDTDGQYTIGYGTRCPADKVAYYKENPMTKEEADAALRVKVAEYEKSVNKFIDRHGLSYNQGQFDAVISLVFNCGTGCLSSGETLIKALTSGAKGNDLIYAFSIYSSAGGVRSVGLLRRRLAEANMYLNGKYSRTVPSNFCYVIYNGNGGTVSTSNAQGYDSNLTAKPIPTATYKGYTFQGWYTSATGGKKVTVLDASTRNITLYARWGKGTASETKPTETTAPTTEAPKPTTKPTTSPTTKPTTKPTTQETTVPAPTEPPVPEGKPIKAVQVQVTGSGVNVRSGPGLKYKVVDQVGKGDKLSISATYESDGYLWGKFELGWVSLRYTNYETVINPPKEEPKEEPQVKPTEKPKEETQPKPTQKPTEETQPKPTQKPTEETQSKPTEVPVEDPTQETTAPIQEELTEEPKEEVTDTKTYATVVKTFTLNVRENPEGAIVDVLKLGDKVEILERTVVDGRLWGRCELGWICLKTYAKLDTATQDADGAGDVASEDKVFGTVIKCASLNVRMAPNGAVVDKLSLGERVEILEQKTVDGRLWGRCAQGWVCMSTYFALESNSETDVTEPDTTEPDNQVETEATDLLTGKVIASCLNVRSDASTDEKIFGKLFTGEIVVILEQKTIGGTDWARIDKGWICMDYIA